MSAKVGGNYACYHGINTDSLDEFNEHLLDPRNGHTYGGTSPCIHCGVTLVFDGIPFKTLTPDGIAPDGVSIQMVCPACAEKMSDTYKNKQVIRIENPSKGFRMLEPHETGRPIVVNVKQDDTTKKKGSSKNE